MLLKGKNMNAMYPVRCRFATLVRSTKNWVLWVVGNCISVRETVDHHDGVVMWMVDVRGFDDTVGSRWDADMMCSVGQSILGDGWPMRVEL
jgi:hypothetical protein